MPNDQAIIYGSETHGTSANVNIVLDEDSKSLYSAGCPNRDLARVPPSSSSSGQAGSPTVTPWEEVLKTIRL